MRKNNNRSNGGSALRYFDAVLERVADCLHKIAEDLGLGIGKLMMPLRLIMLGKSESKRRVELFLNTFYAKNL